MNDDVDDIEWATPVAGPALPREGGADPVGHERLASGRRWRPLLIAALVMTGAVGLLTTGDPTPEAAPPTDTQPSSREPLPSTVPPTTTATPRSAVAPTVVAGALAGGAEFTIDEPMPGVLCAVIVDAGSSESSADRICHHEHQNASGAAVLDELIFGYLTPGASTAQIRYRRTSTAAAAAVVDEHAGFFAVPILGDDPYRLQYLDDRGAVVREEALIPPNGEPSQSPADAERDGVDPAVAALPFNRRVAIQAEVTTPDEGPYAVSSVETDTGRMFELLLLDSTGTRIERATPLGDRKPTQLVVGAGAVFVLAEADQRNPVLVRVDRASGERRGRLIDIGRDAPPSDPDWWEPGVVLRRGAVVGSLRWFADGTVAVGVGRDQTVFAADTLEPIEE